MEEVDELELMVERVVGLDLGKAELVACVRVPHPSEPGRRMQEIRTYRTTTAQLLELAAWLRAERVQRVVMESTGDYAEGRLLPARGRGLLLLAGERPGCEEPARAGEDGHAGFGLAGEGSRARHVRAVAGTPTGDTAVAGPGSVPARCCR